MLTLLSVSCLSLLLPALRPPLVAHARCLPPAAQDGGRDGARNSPTATGTVDASRGGSRGRGDSRGRGSSRGRGGSRGRGRGGRGWYTSGGVPRIGQLESAAEVLAAFDEHGHKFRPQDVASSWNALGKLVRRPAERQWLARETDERLAPLKEQTLQAVPTFPAKALAISAHGLASIESRTRWRAGNDVWRAVAERGVDVVREFNPQELSNTAWAFATAKHPTPAALLDAIAVEATGRVREFSDQGLANTAWAFATAGHAAPALLDAIAAEAAGRVREFKSQELSNTAWAYATTGHWAPELLDVIAAEAAGRVREFTPQALSNTAWAFATAGHAAPALLDAIAAQAFGRIGEFTPQALSITVWAFATAGHAAPALLDVIAAEAAERVREFNPQELSNTAWAFATAGHVAPALLDAIAAEAVGRVREFNDQELTNTAWAFATAGHAAPALLDAIAVEATGRVGDFNEQGLSNTAWAFATAGHAAPALLDAIAAEAAGRVGDFTPQALANTAWACAVADSCADALFDDPLFTARCLLFEQAFSPSELCQLHQWQLWRDERSADWPPLPPSLAQRCRDAFGEGGSRPSQLQSQVADALRAMGLQVQEEVRTSLGHSLDAVVLVDGREVGIEVDGPSHFVGRTPTGSTALKRRQLKAAGWTLLPVPYWEWAEVGRSNPQARRRLRFEYLSSLLEPRMTQPAEGGAPTAQGESES